MPTVLDSPSSEIGDIYQSLRAMLVGKEYNADLFELPYGNVHVSGWRDDGVIEVSIFYKDAATSYDTDKSGCLLSGLTFMITANSVQAIPTTHVCGRAGGFGDTHYFPEITDNPDLVINTLQHALDGIKDLPDQSKILRCTRYGFKDDILAVL